MSRAGTSSASTKQIQSPFAARRAALRVCPAPRFLSFRSSLTLPSRAAYSSQIAKLPSVDRSSASTTSSRLYVCPVCSNVIQSIGEALVSCCGITLPPLEAEYPDAAHDLRVEVVEDEYYVTVDHPMTKDHCISFLAAASDHGVQLVKLYPEGNAEARFKIDGVRRLYGYCNRHGLFGK